MAQREGLASFVGARIARNGSDQWLAAHGQPPPTAMPASPFASRGSGRPIQMERTDHSVEGNPTGASGPHATAACPLIGATGRLARATTDSHREARPARLASGASTLHQPLRPLRAGWPPGPSPHDAASTPSLSQWRSELRRPDGGRAGLASFVGARTARNSYFSGSR